ncbi:MAG: IS200/IS605 family transposase [Planctomycetia bacterium]|nr:IS200/IS605 family transposase [Planctomycetia bacterium]
MPQSLSQVLLHIIFSTKHRAARLQDVELRKRLHAYMATILNDNDSPTLIINGTENHIHILCMLSRKWSVAQLIQEVKTEPSKWLKQQRPDYFDFHWQNGYGAFSVSSSMKDTVYRYIENQEEHHRAMSYEDEFRTICSKHGISWDERYVWD